MVIPWRDVPEAIRFAAGVASRPSGVLTLWKVATGGKAVGCLPSTPVPELLYAANLLPIVLESGEDFSLFPGQIDAWLIGADPSTFHAPPVPTSRFSSSSDAPVNLEAALDRIEALSEWVGAVSGSPASEGALWKSIRAYATRRSLLKSLDERIGREGAILTSKERRCVVRAGNFLPPEAHTRLLSLILGIDHDSAAFSMEGEKGDPLIVLARRLI